MKPIRIGPASLFFAIMAVVPLAGSVFWTMIATEVLIMGLFAMSFNLIYGYMGQISFGHAAFFGVGAYATAMMGRHFGYDYGWFFLALAVSRSRGGDFRRRHRVLRDPPHRDLLCDFDDGLRRAHVFPRLLVLLGDRRRQRNPGASAAAVLAGAVQLSLLRAWHRGVMLHPPLAHHPVAVRLYASRDPR